MKNQTFKQKAIRHGEVVITPIDALPAGIEQVYEGREFVVGHSETGHHHVAVAELPTGLTVFKPRGADDQTLFLRVSGGARVEHRKTHDRHEPKSLLEGLYTVTIKKAYDYFAKRMTRVMD